MSLAARRDGFRAVDQNDARVGQRQRKRTRIGNARAGRHADFGQVVRERQRGNFRALAVRQIFDAPASAVRRPVEKSRVRHEVARHAAHTRVRERGHERRENVLKIRRFPAWVAAPGHDQIAAQHAGGVRSGRGQNRRGKFVIAAERVECERARVKLAVRRRAHQPVCVVFVNDLAGVERNNFHAPQRAAETRLVDVRIQLCAQFGERFGEICRLRAGGWLEK